MNTPKMKLADENFITDDVRMRGFKQRSSVKEVVDWLDKQTIDLSKQTIPLQEATGRVLAQDITSEINIPSFARSMMDGYALISADTQGASSYNPLQLQVVGKSMPGQGTTRRVTSGMAIRIMTGAPVPEGAGAVLPAENVEIDETSILVMESVAEGRNIGRIGEDVRADSTILKHGRC